MLGSLFTEQYAFSQSDSIIVVGLGTFGGAVAQSLIELGNDVMGIDSNEETVQEWAHKLTYAVQADATDVQVLRQLGVADFSHAIISIGNDMSANLMALLAVSELNIKDIWVKAMSPKHGHIAQRIGAHHVVYPEADMGRRIAHMVTSRMMDYIEFDDGYAIAKIWAPPPTHNKSLTESIVRGKFGVTIVGVKRSNEDFVHATPETRILPGDILIVSGPKHLVEKFSAAAKEN